MTDETRIEFGMPADVYHADPCPSPSLSTGIAKLLHGRHPLAAWREHPRLNPDHERVDRDTFDLGTIAHALLLEDDDSRLVVVDADDWRTKAAREERDLARANGKIALLAKHADAAQSMCDAARAFLASSEIADDWAHAVSEASVFWREPNGVWCRCRPDRLADDRRVIVDYKTTANVDPRAFQRVVASLGYHIQDALYRRGVSQLVEDHSSPKFVFLAQEKSPPYECALYACDPELQAIGDQTVAWSIAKWGDCLARNDWPGYPSRVQYLEPTGWMRWDHDHDGR